MKKNLPIIIGLMILFNDTVFSQSLWIPIIMDNIMTFVKKEANNNLGVGAVLAGERLYFTNGWIEFDPTMSIMTSFENGEIFTREISRVEDNKIYFYSEEEEGIYLYVYAMTDTYVDFIKGKDGLELEDDYPPLRTYFNESDVQ